MTIEELKTYKQLRTPDYAVLATLVNKAKGEKRTMAQFATETGIGASTLSRIANMKIQKPLSNEMLISIYKNRADTSDERLGTLLIRANGLVSPSEAERITNHRPHYARQYEFENIELMMKNAIIAGVSAAGVPTRSERPSIQERRQMDVPA